VSGAKEKDIRSSKCEKPIFNDVHWQFEATAGIANACDCEHEPELITETEEMK
jgi:hypothetical protein